MTLIRRIEESQAEGELREVYARIGGSAGRVPDILKAESLAPRVLAAHCALYRELLLGASPLSLPQRELLAVAVRQANACHYGIEHHAASFRRYVQDEARAEAVRCDARSAPLAPADRARVRGRGRAPGSRGNTAGSCRSAVRSSWSSV